VQKEAVSTYRDMLITQVIRFKGKSADDIPCTIIIDEKNLESVEENE